METRRNHARDTCCSCHRATKKRCGECYLEWFCSPECIQKEWSAHKIVCHKRKSEYLGFEFIWDIRSVVISLDTAPCLDLNGKLSRSYFIVKIKHDGPWNDFCIRDRNNSVFYSVIEKNTKSAKMLINIIKNKGVKGVLGYFAAFVKEKKIYIHPEIQPVETW